jgi:hypothetical protein
MTIRPSFGEPSFMALAALVLAVSTASPVRAEEPAPAKDTDTSIKQSVDNASNAADEAAHRIKDAGVQVGVSAKQAAHAIGDGARDGYLQAKAGVINAWHALKGD